MGTLQALEAIKTISGIGETMCGKLMVFDSMSARLTTTLNVAKERNPRCVRCGDADFDVATYDYDAFLADATCGARAAKSACDDDRVARGGLDVNAAPVHGPGASIDADLQEHGAWKRVTPREFDARAFDCVVDVRPTHAYDAAHLQGAISIPIDVLDGDTARAVLETHVQSDDAPPSSICFVCAGGNNSQRAADWFARSELGKRARVYDLCGGLAAWRREVDATFPQLS
jgi:adenylyltransferase/sulfurtransferase